MSTSASSHQRLQRSKSFLNALEFSEKLRVSFTEKLVKLPKACGFKYLGDCGTLESLLLSPASRYGAEFSMYRSQRGVCERSISLPIAALWGKLPLEVQRDIWDFVYDRQIRCSYRAVWRPGPFEKREYLSVQLLRTDAEIFNRHSLLAM